MQKEKQVRTYQRKTKSGKVVVVRAHKAKYDAAEDLKKSITKKKGSGLEMESLKNENIESPFGVEMDDFKEWYAFNDWDAPKKEWPVAVRRVDKALVSGMGKKSYDDFCAKVDESWTARGYRRAMKDLSALSKSPVVKQSVSDATKSRRAASISDEVDANGSKSYSKEEGSAMLKRIQKAGFNRYMQGLYYDGYKFNDPETGDTLWMNVSTDKRGRMHFDTMHPYDRDEHYNYYEKERAAAKKKDMEHQKARMAAIQKVAKKLPKGSFRTVDENGNEIPGAPKHGTKFKADKVKAQLSPKEKERQENEVATKILRKNPYLRYTDKGLTLRKVSAETAKKMSLDNLIRYVAAETHYARKGVNPSGALKNSVLWGTKGREAILKQFFNI